MKRYSNKNACVFPKVRIFGKLLIFSVSFTIFWFSLPQPLFQFPTSTVIENANGKLLAASVATDGQWRFAAPDSVPKRFAIAITTFEDQYFYYHLGFNPIAFLRAVWQNIAQGKIVSGASTLSMQVIRLSRQQKNRTFLEKIIEIILAFRLELSHSKSEILNFYATYAPFGGNVVGLEAASWRYFGRSAYQLSWAETAVLAVLPNSPSLIFPGKNENLLLKKRNRLLEKLYKNHQIDSLTCALAQLEPLPQKPIPLPQITPHLMTHVIRQGKKGQRITTTIDENLQRKITRIAQQHYATLKGNYIQNMAIVVSKVQTGEVIAYIGNVAESAEAADVDNIQALRSYGSLLKPLLYAAALQEGMLLPNMLLPDVPMQIAGYQPENYYRNYDGAVPASEALYRSLNVPAVWLQRQYSTQNFLQLIKKCDLTTFDKTANHYGLSLVLGGAEATLWELTQLYNRFAQQLNGKQRHHLLHYETSQKNTTTDTLPLSRASLWHTAQALTQSYRPDEWDFWKNFSTTQKIAWKTGTSFGLRDAWAIGFNAEYTVGVWVGNSSGIGRPNLVGVQVAAPILFQVFDNLPLAQKWFEKPSMPQLFICTKSGHKANAHCPQTLQSVPNFAEKTEICPYHQLVYTNADSSFLLNSSCASSAEMIAKKWFVLPVLQGYYYRQKHPHYKNLPPLAPHCQATTENPIAVVYPLPNTVVHLPQLAQNEYSELVLKATHTDPKATLFWHLNEKFLGKTTDNKHTQVVALPAGDYQLTLIDEQGNTQTQKIRVRRR